MPSRIQQSVSPLPQDSGYTPCPERVGNGPEPEINRAQGLAAGPHDFQDADALRPGSIPANPQVLGDARTPSRPRSPRGGNHRIAQSLGHAIGGSLRELGLPYAASRVDQLVQSMFHPGTRVGDAAMRSHQSGAIASHHERLAYEAERTGDPLRVAEHLELAAWHREASGNLDGAIRFLARAGQARAAIGDTANARKALERASTLRGSVKHPATVASYYSVVASQAEEACDLRGVADHLEFAAWNRERTRNTRATRDHLRHALMLALLRAKPPPRALSADQRSS